MKGLASYALCVLIACAPGCAPMTPQQRSAVRQTIEADYDAGLLTKAQRDVMLETLESQGGSVNWDWLLRAGTNALFAFLLGAPVVGASVATTQYIRGPSATQAERAARSAARAAARVKRASP